MIKNNTTQKPSRSEYSKLYYQRNKEKRKEYLKRWCKENKEYCSKWHQEYYNKNKKDRLIYLKNYFKKNPDKYKKHREGTIKWVNANRDKINIRVRKKYYTDIQYKLSNLLRTRILHAVKRAKTRKCGSTAELIGCDILFLRQYIESQFTNGMSWKNYKLDGWHIDHIKPCNTFDLHDPEQQRQCFHYTNLRPLWATDNLSRPKNGKDVI